MNFVSLTFFSAIFLVSESALAWKGSYDGQAIVQAIAMDKPNDPDSFVVDKQKIVRSSYREAGLIRFGQKTKFEYAAYLVAQQLSARDDLDHLGLLHFDPRFRSYSLDLHIISEELRDVFATIDRLNLRFTIKQLRVAMGRMPLDLSKAFIFRTNDIFGPANYNHLDPLHKTGVDTIQFSGPLAPLGEWKLIATAGYEKNEKAEVDQDGRYLPPSNRFSGKQSSVLACYMNTFDEYSFQLDSGIYRDRYILMLSTEGEINNSWSLRMELKDTLERSEQKLNHLSAVVGVDYRLNDTNLIFGEFYLNGEGLNSIEDLENITNDPYNPLSQFGQRYLGLGLNSDITPLWGLKLVGQGNLTDSSSYFSASLTYSLSEKTDLTILTSTGSGRIPEQGNLKSEFGGYPMAVAIEANIHW